MAGPDLGLRTVPARMGGHETERGQAPWSQWGLNVSEVEARHRGKTPRSRIFVRRLSIGVGVFLMVVSLAAVLAYKHLEGNIRGIEIPAGDRPAVKAPAAVNILVMGSDTRAGANGAAAGGSTPGLSDTTLILHLSASRKYAYGVSLPRDAMVERPDCAQKDGSGISSGGLVQFNSAYAVGGPLCTVKTVEALTGIRMNHFVVIDFVGFKAMVDAINGVEICVPEEVNDTVGNINLPAGTYNVSGQQALDYVRVRHDIGAPTGDIGRMKRQQTFIAAMINKVVSAGTLANPVRLFNFLDAATESLTTDKEFANLKQMASLGRSLKNIGLDKVKFVTVPFQAYAPDPNRLEWKPEAAGLWSLIRNDKPLTAGYAGEAVTAGPSDGPTSTPSSTPSGKPSSTATPGSTPTPSSQPTKSQEQKDAEARAAGLCTS